MNEIYKNNNNKKNTVHKVVMNGELAIETKTIFLLYQVVKMGVYEDLDLLRPICSDLAAPHYHCAKG